MNHGHRTGVIPRIFLLFCLLTALPDLSPTTLHAKNLGLDKETLKQQLTDVAIERIFSGLPNMPEDKLKDAAYFNELIRDMEPFGVKLDETNFTETALNIYNKYKEEYEKEQDPVKAKQKVEDLLKGDVRTLIFQSLDKGSQEVLTDLQGLYGDAEGELNKVLKLNEELEKDPDADYAKLMKDFGLQGEYLEKFEKLEGDFNAAYEKYGDYYNASKIIYTGMTGHSGDKIEALFELGATFGGKIPVLGKFVELYFKVAQEMLKATGRLGKLLQERQQGCLGVGTVGWIQTISSATNDRNVAFSAQFPNVVACPANEAMEFYRDIYEQVGSVNQLYFWTDSGFVEGNPKHGGINAVKAFRSWLRSNNQADKANDLQFTAKSYNIPPGFPEKQRQLEAMIEDVNRMISSLRQALGSCTSDDEFAGFLLDRGGLQRVVDTSAGNVKNDSYLWSMGLYIPFVIDKTIEDRYVKENIIFNKACDDAQKKLRNIVVTKIKGDVFVKKGDVPEPTSGVAIKVAPMGRVIEKCSKLSTDRNGSFEIIVVKNNSDIFSMNLQADDGTNTSDEVSISISGDKKTYDVKLNIKGECKEGELFNETGKCVPVFKDNEQARNKLLTAKELAAKGSYDKAVTEAEEALKLDPKNSEISQLITKWTADKKKEQQPSAAASPPIKTPPTPESDSSVQAAMLAEIEAYLNQFKGKKSCFGDYISLGDIGLFSTAVYSRLRLIVGEKGAALVNKRKDSKAYHDSEIRIGDVASSSPPYIARLVFPFDPRNLSGKPLEHSKQQQTMMHEMTHHMEWLAGVKPNNKPRSERNTNYQDQVIDLLGKWVLVEKNIMEGKTDAECQFVPWQNLWRRLRQLEAGDAAGGFAPDGDLKVLNGFQAGFDDIRKAYLNEDCKEELKKLASLPPDFNAPNVDECDKRQDEREKRKKDVTKKPENEQNITRDNQPAQKPAAPKPPVATVPPTTTTLPATTTPQAKPPTATPSATPQQKTQQVEETAAKPRSITQFSEEEKKDFLDCICSCGSSFGGGGYHPEPSESSYSPSCDDLANGPCRGGGRGACFRWQMPTGGECVTNCYAQYNVIPDSNATNILTAENKKHKKPLKVMLAPDAKPIKAQYGTTVSLTATVEGGQPGYTYSWSGQGDAKDNTYSFINTREPGTFAVAVTVKDSDGGSATAATSIVVEAPTVTIEKISPAGNTVPVGGQASFKATITGGTDVNYLWQPHPEVEFNPFEKSATTTATFRNPESVGVWVEVLVKDGAVMRPAGRSNVITMQVANPQWALEFIPASPRVGQPVKAKISPTGPQAAAINTAGMNFRWQLPANAKQTGTSQDDREITFVLHDTKPANISCTAATKRNNENLGGAGKTITAQEYAVKVSGPRGRQEFRIWKCETQLGGAPECGMKKVENQFAAGNEILFGATVVPLPEKPVSYTWTASPGGCAIASPFSRDIGLTCSSTGSYTITVIAKSDGLEIGSSSANVSVTISQNDINNSNKSKQAYEKLQKAKELVSQGKLDEGIVLIDEALKLDPKLTEAAALGPKWKSEKQNVMKHVESIKNLLPADEIAQADKELAAAQKLHPKYAPVVEVEKTLDDAKKTSAEKKIKEQAEAVQQIGTPRKENAGSNGSPEKNPNDSASRGGCSEELIVLHNNYQGVCSYTNSTSFTIVKATNITRIRIWFDTSVGGKTLSATLSRSNGYKIAAGTIARGECQGGWCEAIWNLDQVLKAGTFTLTADSTSICADPSGQTTLALYGCLYSQENVSGRQDFKPENAPAPASSVTRVTPGLSEDVHNLDDAIAKIEGAIAIFNSSIAEIEARSKTLKGADNIAAANNEINEAKKYLPLANAELMRLKGLKQPNEKGPVASGNSGSWEYVGIGDCPGNDIAGGAAGSVPDPVVCDSQHAGLAAVCWDGATPRVMSPPGCTVKSVRAENCTGGVNPGRMYRCAFQAGSQSNSTRQIGPEYSGLRLGPMEMDTDRMGADIRSLDLPTADPALCQAECARTRECMTWTYVKPDTKQGPRPRCWLKHASPGKNPDASCISGVIERDSLR